MNKKYILLAIAISLCLSISADAANRRRGKNGKKPIPEALKKFDLNMDGKITFEERKAYLDAQRNKTPIEASDNNQDGKLDKYERIMARDRKIKEMDKDGDGKISKEERQAGMAARKAAMEEKMKQRIAEFDADGDGMLSDAEKANARQSRLQNLKTKNPEAYQKLITKFDKNGDGILDATELKPDFNKMKPRPTGSGSAGFMNDTNRGMFRRNGQPKAFGQQKAFGQENPQKIENQENKPFPRNPGLFPRKNGNSPFGKKPETNATGDDGGFLTGVDEGPRPMIDGPGNPQAIHDANQENLNAETDQQNMSSEDEKLLELLDF